MNFHRYRPLAGQVERELRKRGHDHRETAMVVAAAGRDDPFHLGEREWAAQQRPYYRLWPGIIGPLLSLRLEKVQRSHITLPVRALCLELPVGRSVQLECGGELAAVIAWQDGLTLRLVSQWATIDEPVSYVELPAGDGPVEDFLADRISPRQGVISQAVTLENIRSVVRLACMISLLRDDPDLIMPRVLADDRAEWERTHDIALVERARRRGNVGWDIGATLPEATDHAEKIDDCERRPQTKSPHYRHPHPALVWTGRRADPQPKIVLRSGSFVHGSEVQKVPQGYYGSEAPPACPYCLRPMMRDAGHWSCENCAALRMEHVFGHGARSVREIARSAGGGQRRRNPGRGKTMG